MFNIFCNTNIYSVNHIDVINNIVKFDTSKIEIRKLNETEQKELLANKDYRYDRIGPAPKSMWERFWDWFWRKLDEIFSSKGGSIGMKTFQYLLIAAAIVIVVLLLVKNGARNLFYGKSASVSIDFKEFEEDINKLNFDDLIQEAIDKKDFRKAVRLHFLKLLKQLSDNKLINWKIDKTNLDYSIELANSSYNATFKELVKVYEYIWYGDFQLNETNYKSSIEQFKNFGL